MPNPLLQNENQELLIVETTKEYSAGSGIDITSGVISLDPYISASIDSKLASADFGTYSANVAQDIAYVSANAGKTYYAGDNIGISDEYVISSKDWTNDISNASAYAYNQAIAQIPAPQDLSYMSGAIDTNSSDIQYISSVAITSHQDWTDTIKGASSYAYNQATAQIPPQFDPTYMSGAIDTNSSDIQYISGSLTGYQPTGDYATTTQLETVSGDIVSMIPSTAGLATETLVENVSADITSLIPDVSNFITNASAEVTYQPIGNYASASDITGFATKTELETTSGEIVNLIPSTAGLATENDLQIVSGGVDYISGALTGYQPIGSYATTSELNATSGILSGAVDYISGVAVTSTAGLATTGDLVQVSGDITGLIPTDYYTNANPSGFITNISAETTYQPIGQYASATDITGFALQSDLESTSATITGMIPSTAGLATETDLQIVSGGVDYISGVALTSIPTGTMNITGFEYDGDDLITAYNGSAFAGQGGGSIDTIPVAVISPLVTGFSGESAYLGIESTALNLSSYVPVSAISVDSTYGWINKISGRNISAYNAATAGYANEAYQANRATRDGNGNTITSYYQPKLTIDGADGTITAINSSAIGGTMTAAFELSAGDGISIVDDLVASATVISVTGGGGGGNPEVEQVVQTYSAEGTWLINSDLSGYLTTGQYETDSAVFNAKQDALTFTTANPISTASNYGFVPITGISGINGSPLIIPMQAIQYVDTRFYATESAVNRIYKKLIAADLDGQGNYIKDTYQKVSGVSANEWNSNYETVATNSGSWGGQSLPISAGAGIGLSMVDGVLVISVTGGN